MSNEIKVIVKKPGEEPYETTIPNTLEACQDLVGGYIEVFPVATDACIICNEEGLLRDLPFNCIVQGNPFVGPIVFAGIDGEDFADYPLRLDEFKYLYRSVTEV